MQEALDRVRVGAVGIEVRGLTKAYGRGKTHALDDVSLDVKPGEIFGLIGPNGAGKTTFICCLLGLLRPTRGTVLIDGRSPDDVELRAASGYLPERLQFDRWMTGRRFMAYQHALARRPAEARAAEVSALLERVGLEAAHWKRRTLTFLRRSLEPPARKSPL
jgi:ABC-2 type transport system ATP-binding protein